MLKALLAMIIAGAVVMPAAARVVLHKVLASPLVEEGAEPDGCTPAISGLGGPSIWQVRIERFLLDGKALVEVSREAEPNRFPLCIADLPVAKNAEVELSFVPHDGGSARAAGIVVRFVDPEDFYVAEADAVAGSVRLLRVVNGERRAIAEHARRSPPAGPKRSRSRLSTKISAFRSTARCSSRRAITRLARPAASACRAAPTAGRASAIC
jgi:hypothetical protein